MNQELGIAPHAQAYQAFLAQGNKPIYWRELIDAHFKAGTVISTPELFILFRPVEVDWTSEELCDPWKVSDTPNAYHVFLAAGDLSKVEPYLPKELPFITFHRDGGEKVHKLPYWQFIRGIIHLFPLLGNRRQTVASSN